MKILNLSDLHINKLHYYNLNAKTRWIKALLKRYQPELIVITGDIFESINFVAQVKGQKAPGRDDFDPYIFLHELFEGIPIIATLGNHEFCYLKVKDVLEYFTRTYNPDAFDVHYLDIVGFVEIGDYNFTGNILWYDGSQSTVEDQDLNTFADGRWLDREILNFNWKRENQKCVKQIGENLKSDKINILCTHCTPHWKLNGHIKKDVPYSRNDDFNAFGGMADFLKDIDVEYAFCGHTHLRRCLEINGVNCINCGNDYGPPYQHFFMEI